MKRATKKAKYAMGKYRTKSLTAKVNNILKSQELKWYDTSVASATAGQVTPLNTIPQGDDAVARDGRKIVMKSCWIRVTALGNSGAGSICPRVALVYDKNPNGLLPVFSDIFTSAGSVAFANLNNKERFQILYDNTAGLNDPCADVHIEARSTSPFDLLAQYHVNKYVPMNHTTIFGSTGQGTQAGTQTGGLYLVALAEPGSTSIALVANMRVRFLDS